jgi:transcriptional regulator GlxA family with amidase domain
MPEEGKIRIIQPTRRLCYPQDRGALWYLPIRSWVDLATGDEKNKTIAVVAYPGVSLLDLVVTQTVLDRGTKYRTVSVAERTEPMKSNTPMAFVPERRFEEVPDPFAIIVPGGDMASLEAMGNERLINYLRFAEHGAELIASVSTGAFLLAAAGLLDGRRATTHPAYSELLKKLGMDYVRSYSVEDGRFLTMEGVSSGIDTTLRLVAKLRGEAASRRAEMIIEYDPQPPFGAIDWGEANGDGLGDALDEHREELETALSNRQDLYQKLFG